MGTQFLTITVGIIFLALMGFFNVHNHGAVNSAACFLYALTSFISGYVSSYMYKTMGGEAWVNSVNLTSCLFSCKYDKFVENRLTDFGLCFAKRINPGRLCKNHASKLHASRRSLTLKSWFYLRGFKLKGKGAKNYLGKFHL